MVLIILLNSKFMLFLFDLLLFVPVSHRRSNNHTRLREIFPTCYCHFRLLNNLLVRLIYYSCLFLDRHIEARGWSAYGKGGEGLGDGGGNGRHHWEVNVAHIDRE